MAISPLLFVLYQMPDEKSLKKSLSNLFNKKVFTSSIADKAILAVKSNAISFDISRDYYTKREFNDKLSKIRNCASLLEIRKYENGDQRIHNGNFCGMPVVCTACADKVSRRKKAIWKPIIKAAVKYNPDTGSPKFRYVYLITMTIKDGKRIEERIDKLVESKKNHRKMGQKRKRKDGSIYRGRGEWRKLGAGISSTEMVSGENSKEWHVHEHLLGFSNERIDYSIYWPLKYLNLKIKYGVKNDDEVKDKIPDWELAAAVREWYFPQGDLKNAVPVSKASYEWIKATKGQGISFDVRPIGYAKWKKNKFIKERYFSDYSEWIAEQAAEVLKYNSKLAEGMQKSAVNTDQYSELILRRGCRRLFNSYGAFRNRTDSLYFSPEEEAYMQFLENRDAMTYEIDKADVSESGYNTSRSINGPVFSSSDSPGNDQRCKLSQQSLVVSDFRSSKRGSMDGRKHIQFLDENDPFSRPFNPTAERWRRDIESFIDEKKEGLKAVLRVIWRSEVSEDVARAYSPPPF